MRIHTRSEGWGTALRAMYFVVLTVVLGYLGTTTLPIVFKTFKFSQAIEHEVTYGTVNEPVALIHSRLVAEAQRLGLDVAPDDIVVRQRGSQLQISASYVARIELPGGIRVDWPWDTQHEGVRRAPVFNQIGP